MTRRAKPAFDPDRVRQMLFGEQGNVTRVALDLNCDSQSLRAFIRETPMLTDAMDEIVAQGVDESLTVLFDGLRSDNQQNRLSAAKVFLKSRAAARRGFAPTVAELELKGGQKGSSLTLTWLAPDAAEPKLIEDGDG